MLQKEFKFRSLMVRDEDGKYRLASGDEIIEAAMSEMQRRFSRGTTISSPEATKEFLQLRLGHLEHEVFAVLWLDNRHRVIEFEELFRGTIDGASVHPREVVKMALRHNAAAAILAHYVPRNIMLITTPYVDFGVSTRAICQLRGVVSSGWKPVSV